MTVDADPAADRILAGLNPEQRRAAEAVHGPVCILAGAGSGKTTTVTRRIAWQVASGAFRSSEILAVTFTEKAAGELKGRLAALGVQGVVARTFHAAALAQLRGLSADPPGRILSSKVPLLRELGNRLPGAYRFRPAMDLASEIEWAKARRIGPNEYEAALGDRKPPIPADLMARIYMQYEKAKRDQGLVDFDDMLGMAVRLFEEDERACDRFRDRYRAFTVDEYQDVNDLQQRLLDLWLGGRDDLCVVGDDHQAIYSFTGASAGHLLGVPRRYPHAVVVKLEENHRSTPQVLSLANKLAPMLGGSDKRLRAVREDGPAPVVRAFDSRDAELAFVVERLRAAAAEGVPWEEMALLYRTNQRSEDYEEALADADIPYQVRGGAFLERPAAKRLLRVLRSRDGEGVGRLVREAAQADGLLDTLVEGLGEQEETRQADLTRLVRLAETFDVDGSATVGEFLADLDARFRSDGDGRGVQLLTYHRSKGLEFEAVLLPRLEEGDLPVRQAKDDAQVDEERRLLYVGITRAKRHLALSWAGKRSRFLGELGLGHVAAPRAAAGSSTRGDSGDGGAAREALDTPLGTALRSWRLDRARQDNVPAYVVFSDRTLAELAERRPLSLAALSGISGIGPAKLERYGEELLGLIGERARG